MAVTSGNHDRSLRAIVRAVESASPGLPVVVGGGAIAGADHAAPLGAVWSGGDVRGLVDVIEGLDRPRRLTARAGRTRGAPTSGGCAAS